MTIPGVPFPNFAVQPNGFVYISNGVDAEVTFDSVADFQQLEPGFVYDANWRSLEYRKEPRVYYHVFLNSTGQRVDLFTTDIDGNPLPDPTIDGYIANAAVYQAAVDFEQGPYGELGALSGDIEVYRLIKYAQLAGRFEIEVAQRDSVIEFSYAERPVWEVTIYESRGVLASPSFPTPTLDLLVVPPQTVAQLAQEIVDEATLYAQDLVPHILVKEGHRAAIAALTTIQDILDYDINSGWPARDKIFDRREDAPPPSP